ncbi:MAG: ROK family protein [Lactobacillales bacterium]|jgi:predicted NBD/HSP70 family sugar kinase|nr:ROK family protein [Lactobacillales bacterium]
MKSKICTIDIGGTLVKYAFYSEEMEGKLFHQGEVSVPQSKECLYQLIEELSSKEFVSGVAISMPGLIDSDKGYNFHGGALPFIRDISVEKELQNYLKLPVTVENDGKCAALGEHWKGSLKGNKSGIVIVLGTGIGGGIIVDDKLWRGAHFSAGEFSFLQTDKAEKFPENIWVIQNSVLSLLGAYEKASGERLNGYNYFERVNQGEACAIEILEKYCQTIIPQIYNLQLILDVEKIVIGGGISRQSVVVKTIQKQLADFYQQIEEKIEMKVVHAEVVPTTLGNDANLFGAVAHYLSKIQRKEEN